MPRRNSKPRPRKRRPKVVVEGAAVAAPRRRFYRDPASGQVILAATGKRLPGPGWAG